MKLGTGGSVKVTNLSGLYPIDTKRDMTKPEHPKSARKDSI